MNANVNNFTGNDGKQEKRTSAKSEILKINKKDILSNVKVEDGMFSLTDLWRLAGSPKNQNPNDWQRSETTINLIETASEILNTAKNRIIKSKKGKGGGTYAYKNIALAYAKYLNPKLHLLVNEVFFERIEEERNPDKIVDRAISTYGRKGMSAEWITKRLTGKGIRNEFTSTLKKHGVVGDGYRRCTNAMYIELYGKEASEVKETIRIYDL